MKLIKLITLALAWIVSFSACASTNKNESKEEKDMKAVIVYFSFSGNTERAAKELGKVIGSPVYRIEPEKPYSDEDVNWQNEQSRCTLEYKDQSLRPAIKLLDINFSEINTVFIGFPIWWYQEPAVIRSFLDDYKNQLNGKVLYPFCTSYSTPMSQADESLKKGFPNFDWKTGLRFPASEKQIKEWINQ